MNKNKLFKDDFEVSNIELRKIKYKNIYSILKLPV